MLVRITANPKDYAWGSRNLIQDHVGQGEPNQLLAELWFGTHPAGESLVAGGAIPLSEQTEGPLPFLAKFLAAQSPLSIQVHPTKQQAEAGFAREEAAGISLSDPKRNYQDRSAKPEILVAITKFRALCGFRPINELKQILNSFGAADSRFAKLAEKLESGAGLENIFSELLNDAELAKVMTRDPGLLNKVSGDSDLVLLARKLVSELLSRYPEDTGALIALMLNQVELDPGEAIFLPAGNLHAYLSGLGFEVMAASNNVIRGGLTSKHIDRTELLAVTDFRELLEPRVAPRKLAEGLVEYKLAETEFKVYKVSVSASNLLADLDLPARAMVVCESGEVAVSTSLEEREVIKKGEAVFVSKAKKLTLGGSGSAFMVLG